MMVHVTAHHIAHGERNNATRNPIALALQEQDRFAVVTAHRAHMVKQVDGVFYLPNEIVEWLGRFNAKDSVSPMSFRLWVAT